MRYWDASALVPLVVAQPRSAELQRLLAADPAIAVWWGTRLECVAGITAATRRGLRPGQQRRAWARLNPLAAVWLEIEPSPRLRPSAERLLRAHPLSAADALQLAAALDWCGEAATGRGFVCLDERLRDAATGEGFAVLP